MCAGVLKNWREAATLILTHSQRGNPLMSKINPSASEALNQMTSSKEGGLQVLYLKRSSNSSFMPDMYVFPGGEADNADFSRAWVTLFGATSNANAEKRFGFSKTSSQNAPMFSRKRDADFAALPSEIAFRITAIRETFEESGILIARKADQAGSRFNQQATTAFSFGSNHASQTQEWREKVARNPEEFQTLCKKHDILPDIWSLYDWSNWLTPSTGKSAQGFAGQGQGAQGFGQGQGAQGFGQGQGAQGFGQGQGAQGFTGQGQGAQGSAGQGQGGQRFAGQGQGAQGSAGQGQGGQRFAGQGQGAQGFTGQGQGAQGFTGQGQGAQGSAGQGQGAQGFTGQGQGAQGFTGQGQGAAGQGGAGKRAQGAQGAGQGAQGAGQGAQGASGQGAQGASGQGAQGASGQGAQGTSGQGGAGKRAQGAQGAGQGAQGAGQGAQGASGQGAQGASGQGAQGTGGQRSLGVNRFDAAFYICALGQQPAMGADANGLVQTVWANPQNLVDDYTNNQLQLAPPHLYESARLANFNSTDELLKTLQSRAGQPLDRWMAVPIQCADGVIYAFPGDSLYPQQPDFEGEAPIMQRRETVQQLMKQSSQLHRAVSQTSKTKKKGASQGAHFQLLCNLKSLPHGQISPKQR